MGQKHFSRNQILCGNWQQWLENQKICADLYLVTQSQSKKKKKKIRIKYTIFSEHFAKMPNIQEWKSFEAQLLCDEQTVLYNIDVDVIII